MEERKAEAGAAASGTCFTARRKQEAVESPPDRKTGTAVGFGTHAVDPEAA
jgi:hypothetical protein